MYEFFGAVSVFFISIAYIPYIFGTIKGINSPNIVTWFVLFVLGLISFLAYGASGAKETLGPALANAIGPFVIFLISLKYGVINNKHDLRYLLGSAMAILLWMITGSPVLGLLANLLADFLGFIPTIKKSIRYPRSENLSSWFLFVIGGGCSLLAIREWTLAIVAYPMYIFLAEGVLLFILILGRKKVIYGNSK